MTKTSSSSSSGLVLNTSAANAIADASSSSDLVKDSSSSQVVTSTGTLGGVQEAAALPLQVKKLKQSLWHCQYQVDKVAENIIVGNSRILNVIVFSSSFLFYDTHTHFLSPLFIFQLFSRSAIRSGWFLPQTFHSSTSWPSSRTRRPQPCSKLYCRFEKFPSFFVVSKDWANVFLPSYFFSSSYVFVWMRLTKVTCKFKNSSHFIGLIFAQLIYFNCTWHFWENRSSGTSPFGPVGCPFYGHHRKGDL